MQFCSRVTLLIASSVISLPRGHAFKTSFRRSSWISSCFASKASAEAITVEVVSKPSMKNIIISARISISTSTKKKKKERNKITYALFLLCVRIVKFSSVCIPPWTRNRTCLIFLYPRLFLFLLPVSLSFPICHPFLLLFHFYSASVLWRCGQRSPQPLWSGNCKDNKSGKTLTKLWRWKL